MNEVVVIGGGLVGMSATYRLACGATHVTLIDRMDEGQATAAGAGILSPGNSFRSATDLFPLVREAVAYYPEMLAQLADDGERETGYAVVGALHIATNEEEEARLPDMLQRVRERQSTAMPVARSVP